MRPKLAVIGAGVSGLCAAYINQSKYDITLFEKNDYLGGHTKTFVVSDGPDEGLAIDMGFIVCNNWTYPLFLKFLSRLQVETRNSDMSFGFYCEKTHFCYAGTNLNGLFAKRSNILNSRFYRMIFDVIRFNKAGLDFLEQNDDRLTLGEFLSQRQFSKTFVEDYALPLGASIWSTPAGQMLEFPATSILRFFKNHGLLNLIHRPQWMTVVGGSHAYVKAFQTQFQGKVQLQSRILAVERPQNQAIQIHFAERPSEHFDKVIVATHADEALQLLRDPSREERELLGAWSYQKNRVVLHHDSSVLPPIKRAWASWNYVRESVGNENTHLSMTYHMNRLQGLKSKNEYCVTLNRMREISKASILKDIEFMHPTYTNRSLQTQARIEELNGARNTYYCGSYLGYGFHEDAVRSAIKVSEKLGGSL